MMMPYFTDRETEAQGSSNRLHSWQGTGLGLEPRLPPEPKFPLNQWVSNVVGGMGPF